MKRLIKVCGLLAVLSCVVATSASAGGYTDASYITPVGYTGRPYSHTVSWKPGTGCPPWKYRFSSGELPPGLAIASNGVISGTPTSAGKYTFYIEMFDQCGIEGQGNAPFTITILPGLTVTAPAILPAAVTGASYSYAIPVNGAGPYAWTVTGGKLPDGLSLSNDGTITGTPTTAGGFNFTVQVSNGSLTDTKNVTINVFAPLTAKAATLPVGVEVGVPYTVKLAATGGQGPYSWSVTATRTLPDWLQLDSAAGTIAGTPTAPGRFVAPITVSDTAGFTTPFEVPLTVQARLSVASRSLRPVTIGRRYRVTVATRGGVAPMRWTFRGKLPRGIHFSGKGVFQGTASTAVTSRLRLTVRDALGVTATRSYKLTVH